QIHGNDPAKKSKKFWGLFGMDHFILAKKLQTKSIAIMPTENSVCLIENSNRWFMRRRFSKNQSDSYKKYLSLFDSVVYSQGETAALRPSRCRFFAGTLFIACATAAVLTTQVLLQQSPENKI
ncbi:MAG TPA: hypothetical protein VLH77_04270, partial [Gammaproteobacteria bacterium]|nr:hypothetical protein [Gammaproteobacteria bacterium]